MQPEEIAAWCIVGVFGAIIALIHVVGFILTAPSSSHKCSVASTLEWKNISFSIGTGWRNKQKLCLNGVSGNAAPGEIVAIMGASGSGKTTLLDIVSGNLGRLHSVGTFHGEIYLNGELVTESLLQNRKCCYVFQEDTLIPEFRVVEYIRYISRFLPGASSKAHIKRMEEVIQLLRLQRVVNHRIGNVFESEISGGERRRVSLAEGLLSDCKLIFLDEPTTGLSASDSRVFMDVLRSIAETGCTIVMTIHQPQQSIFADIDKVLLISGGDMVYFGAANQVSDYFASQGKPLDPGENVADSIIDVLESKQQSQELIESWTKDNHQIDFTKGVGEPGKQPSRLLNYARLILRIPKEVYILLRMYVVVARRNPSALYIPAVINLFYGVFTGLLYLNVGDTLDEFGDQFALVFKLIVESVTFTGSAAIYFSLKPNNNLQLLVGRFIVASILISWIITLIFDSIFSAILFSGLSAAIVQWRIEEIVVIVVLKACTEMMARTLFVGASVLAPSFGIALTVTALWMLLSLSVSGFYFRADDMCVAFRWTPYFGMIRQLIDIGAEERLADREYSCDNPYTCPVQGSSVLEDQDLHGTIGFDIANIICWLLGAIIFFTICMYIRSYYPRWLVSSRLNPKKSSSNRKTLDRVVAQRNQAIQQIISENPETITSGRMRIKNRRNTITRDVMTKHPNNSFLTKEESIIPYLAHDPAEDLEFIFAGVNCFVKGSGHQTLHDVWGHVKGGQVLAIMGPSGSGKTTLLKCLAGDVPSTLYSQQQIIINGTVLRGKLLKDRLATFMYQDDCFVPLTKLIEYLHLVCDLQLPHLSFKQRREKIEHTLTTMKLSHVRNTYIEKLSGGERKRLSLAKAFLSVKKIIFLDEPTSGLSGSDSRLIMGLVQELVQANNMIAIVSIHQPRASIFFSLDKLLLLSRGHPVYFDSPRLVQNYFETNYNTLNPEIPNVADAILDLMLHAEMNDNIPQLNQAYIDSTQDFRGVASNYQKKPFAMHLLDLGKYFISLPRKTAREFIVLTETFSRIQIRNPVTTIGFLGTAIFLGCFYGFLLLDMPVDRAETMPSLVGSLFLTCVAFAHVTLGQAFIAVELFWIWMYDYRSGLYSIWVACFVEIILSSFRVMVVAGVYVVLIYFLIGYEISFISFLLMYLADVFMTLFLYLSTIVAMLVIWNEEATSLLVMLYIVFVESLAGYLIGLDAIPGYLYWLTTINPVRYFIELVIYSQLGGEVFPCEDPTTQPPDGCPLLGDDVLEDNYGYDTDPVIKDVLAGVGLTCAITLIMFTIGFFRVRVHRPIWLRRLTWRICSIRNPFSKK